MVLLPDPIPPHTPRIRSGEGEVVSGVSLLLVAGAIFGERARERISSWLFKHIFVGNL